MKVDLRTRTYVKPTVNAATTPTFLFVVIFRFQTDLIGMRRIITSVNVLKRPLALSRLETLTHFPGIDRSQILSLGLHSQIFTRNVAR